MVQQRLRLLVERKDAVPTLHLSPPSPAPHQSQCVDSTTQRFESPHRESSAPACSLHAAVICRVLLRDAWCLGVHCWRAFADCAEELK